MKDPDGEADTVGTQPAASGLANPKLANPEQAEFWSDLAQTWFELDDLLEEVSGPPGLWAMDRLSLQSAQRVVDLGCGTGGTTLELASRVGPDGAVLGVDIAPEMLVHARQRVERAGANNVEFLVTDVQSGDLGEGRFDAAYSRFGVMFFSNPIAALSNVHRALRGGGVLSFACWQSVFENEWMLVPAAAAMSVTGSTPEMPEPDQPGPFSMADPDRVRSLLEDSGFVHVEIEPRNDFVAVAEDGIGDVALRIIRVGAARTMLSDSDEDTVGRVVAAIEEALHSRVGDGHVRISRGVLLVAAGA
jgi:SAM-dependent methyltransferase